MGSYNEFSVPGSWFSVSIVIVMSPVWDQLHDCAFAPSIFLDREIGDRAMQVGLSLCRDDAGSRRELFTSDAHLCFRMRLQIPQPVRGRVFGDQIEESVSIREPDLDFAGQTTPAASSGEIQILLGVE